MSITQDLTLPVEIIIPKGKGTFMCLNSFFPRTLKEWNTLPINLRLMETLKHFKLAVRAYVLFIW